MLQVCQNNAMKRLNRLNSKDKNPRERLEELRLMAKKTIKDNMVVVPTKVLTINTKRVTSIPLMKRNNRPTQTNLDLSSLSRPTGSN